MYFRCISIYIKLCYKYIYVYRLVFKYTNGYVYHTKNIRSTYYTNIYIQTYAI